MNNMIENIYPYKTVLSIFWTIDKILNFQDKFKEMHALPAPGRKNSVSFREIIGNVKDVTHNEFEQNSKNPTTGRHPGR